MKRIRDPRDFWAGVLFVAVGAAAMVLSRRYPFGTTASMGPGYFPTILGALLTAVGVGVAGRALRPSKAEVAIAVGRARPVVLVLVSIVAFGIALPRLGMVLASLLVVAVSRTATPGFRWVEVSVFAAALTLLCVGIFAWGLKMPMPLWPAVAGP
jgi:hypothetical protein